MFLELLSATILGGKYIHEKIDGNIYDKKRREKYQNNPQKQKEELGFRRLTQDLQNGVSREERDRRRALGYYEGKNVKI